MVSKQKRAEMGIDMVHKITGWIFGFLVVYMDYEGSQRFINLCKNNKIEIWNIKAERQRGIIWFDIKLSDFWRLHHIAKKCHEFPRIYKRIGLPFLIKAAEKKINMVVGIGAFFIMLFLLASRIWGIEIEGQRYYTKENITDYLNTIGVYGGMYRGNVDCKMIEKKIRKKYNGIGWVSVNRKGSKIIINVREMTKDKIERKKTPANLVASDDGKIVSIVTSAGVAKVKAGKSVKKGKVIISGVVPVVGDNDEIIRRMRVRADGIVILKTEENYSDYLRKIRYKKVYTGRKKVIYKISLYKNEFFIHNPLNDLETSKKCAILYDGGCVCSFLSKRFPVSFWKATFEQYKYIKTEYKNDEAENELKIRFRDYIRKKEKQGYILTKSNVNVYQEKQGYKATGKIIWLKRQTQYEKIKKIRQKRNIKYGNNGNSSRNTG